MEANVGDIVGHLRIDTSAWQQGLQQATQQLAQFQQATARLTQPLQQVQQGIAGIGQAAGQLAPQFQQATSATSAWTSALAVAGGLGIATSIGAIVGQLKDFTVSVVTVGAQLQQLRASLTVVAGGVQQGAQAFAFAVQTANQYGLSLTTLSQSYRNLLAATRGTALEGEGAQRLFTALTAASRTFGLTSEQTGRALVAFQQIISKGKVSQEELRQQLGEAIPGAMQIAARAFGVTTAELDRMVSKGLDAVEFVRRFTTQLRQETPTAMQGVETAAQAFQRLGNEILLLKDKIAQSGILQFFKDVAAGAANMLKTTREAEEQRQRFTQQRAQQAAGLQALPTDAEQLLQITERLTQAEDRLRVATEARDRAQQQVAGRPSGSFAGSIAEEQRRVNLAQATVDELRRQQTELAAVVRLRERARQGIAARMDLAEGGPTAEPDRLSRMNQAAADAEAANKRLQELLKDTSKDLDTLNKSARETPQAFGSLTGTADQKIEFLDNRIKILRENLEKVTEAIVGRTAQGVIPADLARQKAEFQAQLDQAMQQREAIQDAVQAARKAEREAEQERKREAREAERELEQGARTRVQQLRQLGEEEARQFEQLQRLASAYTQVKAERDSDTASQIAARLATTEYATEAEHLNQIIQETTRIEAQLPRLRAEAAASERLGMEAIARIRQEEALTQRIEAAIAQARGTREERPELRLRSEAERAGLAISPEQEGMLRRLTQVRQEQAQLNEVLRIYEDFASSIGNAWTQALGDIAEGTRTVADAFKQMARSILQSLAQIASQEAFKALAKIGASLLTQAFTGTGPAGGSGAGSLGEAIGGSFGMAYQHGGVVNRPTMALLGESAAHNPEYVLNRHQMQNLLAATPSAGGQAAGGVTVINVASQDEADRQAAAQRAMGREVVINHVLQELARGEGSQIGRLVRLTQR